MNPPVTVGRIVHYQSLGSPGGEYPSVPRAAIVTQVLSTVEVGLCVLNPEGMYFRPSCQYSDTPKAGCWNWPPRA